jgi:hypothetical protein
MDSRLRGKDGERFADRTQMPSRLRIYQKTFVHLLRPIIGAIFIIALENKLSGSSKVF